MLRKKTLRKLSPTTRQFAKLIGEFESTTKRLKNLIEKISSIESDSKALGSAKRPLTPTDESVLTAIQTARGLKGMLASQYEIGHDLSNMQIVTNALDKIIDSLKGWPVMTFTAPNCKHSIENAGDCIPYSASNCGECKRYEAKEVKAAFDEPAEPHSHGAATGSTASLIPPELEASLTKGDADGSRS